MNNVTSHQTADPCFVPVHHTRNDSRCVRIPPLGRSIAVATNRWSVSLDLQATTRNTSCAYPARWNPTGASLERFDDAMTAFQRHAMVQRLLVDEGWYLYAFESERITVH